MLLQDLRHAIRWLRANPGFTSAAVLVLALGIGAATAMTTLIQRVLFNTRAADPATFTIIAAAFLAVAVGSSVLPARRALGINPVEALRSE